MPTSLPLRMKPEGLPEGLVVWADGADDSDSLKLSLRLKVPLVATDDPPGAEDASWLLFYEDDALYLHSTRHEDFNPMVVDYLEGDYYRRWKSASRNDILLKAIGLKKGIRSVCDATCGLGYDAFFLHTFKDLEVIACERNPVVAELAMDALVRVKEEGLFEDRPMQFHFGDGAAFLAAQGPASFDCVYLDPMYPREEEKSAKQKKEMQLLREIVGKDPDAALLFAAAFKAAKRRVVVKRPDDAGPIVAEPKPNTVIEGKTVRYDIYLKNFDSSGAK